MTALWFDIARDVLISSGDDGMLHMWRPSTWAASNNAPLRTINFNDWVTPELKGIPIKASATSLE